MNITNAFRMFIFQPRLLDMRVGFTTSPFARVGEMQGEGGWGSTA